MAGYNTSISSGKSVDLKNRRKSLFCRVVSGILIPFHYCQSAYNAVGLEVGTAIGRYMGGRP